MSILRAEKSKIEGDRSADALRRLAAARLREAGIEEAEADARVLLFRALEGQSADLSPEAVSEEVRARLQGYLVRRLAGEPVARIVGHREFWSLSFALDRETLVPRPETETLVEAALAIFPDRNARLSVLDLGTGTGILLAAVLTERPHASGMAVDRSERALSVARTNLRSLGLSARAQFIVGDWGAALGTRFDLVLCNPPYIAAHEFNRLPLEVAEYDPHLALDGGDDGLDAYRSLIPDLERLLNAEGAAVIELGRGQEAAVSGIGRDAGLVDGAPVRRDLAGIPRALTLRRRP